jgi:hypothetical protein
MSEAGFVVEVAMRSYEQLKGADRIRLLKAAAVLLPENEAKAADDAAWMLEKAEAQQLVFTEALKGLQEGKA